jgi:integrase
MAIFKRGRKYWFHFYFNGQHVQRSTRQANPRVARQVEAAYRTALAKGEVGIVDRRPAPTLKDFGQRFLDNASIGRKQAPRLSTLEFYTYRLNTLTKFEPLASARLDLIKPELVERYVHSRLATVSPTCINRELATLRRCLRVALELGLIDKVPKITLLQGERERTFVLSPALERSYLEGAPQPLRDVAVLMLDTGLRVGEAVSLEWSEIHLEPVNGSRFGYLGVRGGKSRNAKRNVPLTERVKAMLQSRQSEAKTPWVFISDDGKGPLSRSTVSHQHTALRRTLKLPDDFVVHSFRHSALTRLGAAGVDAFTIKRLAGHSSVTISEKYIHPTPEALERAFERLEDYNSRAAKSLPQEPKLLEAATVSATVVEVKNHAVDQVA